MKGITVIGAALIMAVVVLSSSLVILSSSDIIEKFSGFSKFNEMKSRMGSVNNILEELSLESEGSKRKINLNAEDGKFIISGKENKIKYVFTPESSIIEPGTRQVEGNMVISSGPFVDFYENDIDSDGTDDFVLENEKIIFAIPKKGNITNYSEINTTEIISYLKIKNTNIEITPKSKILLDNIDGTSYGNGYTELIESSSSPSIKLYMNASSGHIYEAFFTLRGGYDFVEIKINMVE